MSETNKAVSLDVLVSLAKRRGFVFQSSDIYGGISGFYDYGPYGAQLIANLKNAWWQHYVVKRRNVYGLDSSIVQHPKLWESSGHVAGFNDPLVECSNCNVRHRADHIAGEDSNDLAALTEAIADKACPNCGSKKTWGDVRTFNMMMKTYVGPLESDEAVAYLRPETAGPMFTNFDLVRETTRSKLPFGIGQIGKAFRNEISPRDFIFRVRELEQMEMQYFIDPATEEAEYSAARDFNMGFFTDVIGLKSESLQWHEHTPDERAHYARAAHDIQFKYSMGFKELCGTHNRADFDLSAHMEGSGKDMRFYDQANDKHFVPFVIEYSMGLGRLFMAVLTDAYTEEQVGDDSRVVLKIAPKLAPVTVAVLPLSKKPELQTPANELYDALIDAGLRVEYDETQSIGKRYRRQDEIGTPFCVTVDFDSLDDNAATVRERDSMEQKRMPITEIADYIQEQING